MHRQVAEALAERKGSRPSLRCTLRRRTTPRGLSRSDRGSRGGREARWRWPKPARHYAMHSNCGMRWTTPRPSAGWDRSELLRARRSHLFARWRARPGDRFDQSRPSRALDPTVEPDPGRRHRRAAWQPSLQLAGRGTRGDRRCRAFDRVDSLRSPSSERARALATLAGLLHALQP